MTTDDDGDAGEPATPPAVEAGSLPTESFRARPEPHDGLPADGSLAGPAPSDRESPAGERTTDGVRLADAARDDDGRRRRVLSAVVDHDPGVLSAVSGLFSRRMFNIESLTVGPTADEAYARMTIVVDESGAGVEQARKQLAGLPTVHLVRELDTEPVERELALVKIDCPDPGEVEALAGMHDAEVVAIGPEAATVQITGTERAVDDAVAAFSRFRIREVSRTGTTALDRTADTVYDRADHGTAPPDFDPSAGEEPDATDDDTHDA
ncbi:acetolactate synthase small subunit [Halobaculum sp. MBLA0143]|uniref:acetolactate synthase small subunit n=1 Tax=Halobaculum sp. MBLA0143 TaxID=3079933 RepID=UPI0035253899